MAVRKKYSALGRGLDALISTEDIVANGVNTINEIDVNLIEANPNQPRREFDEVALQELTDSIKEIGIIQPITLREMPDGKYQIIAGERRWRASMRAKMKTIPAYIKAVNEESLMEMALIENIQRQDLNPIEIALAYQHLIDQHGLTQEQLSEKIGKNRATIANFLRLLKLPAPVQVGLRNKSIDTGHARALLSIDEPKMQVKAYNDILAKGMSVRQVEDYVKKVKEGKKIKPVVVNKAPDDTELQLKKQLEELIGKTVVLTTNDKGKGKVTFGFDSIDELKNIIDRLNKK